MGRRIDDQTRNTIVRLLFHRCRHAEIAKELKVSLGMVKKIERNLLDYGTPSKPDTRYTGRPPILKPEMVESLLTKFERTGFEFGQKQLRQWLKEQYNIDVSQSTISRIISKSGRKKAIAVLVENRKLAEGENGHAEHSGLIWIGGPPNGSADSPQDAQNEMLWPSSSSNSEGNSEMLEEHTQLQESQIDPQLSA